MACGGGGGGEGGEGGEGCGGGKGGEGGRVARRLRCTCCCASTMHSARTFAWHFVSSLIVASSPSSALSLWISSACDISLHAPGGGEWPPERASGGEVHRRAGRGDACTHCATVWVVVVSPSCSLVAHASPVLMAASRTDAARVAMAKDRRTEWPAKARSGASFEGVKTTETLPPLPPAALPGLAESYNDAAYYGFLRCVVRPPFLRAAFPGALSEHRTEDFENLRRYIWW